MYYIELIFEDKTWRFVKSEIESEDDDIFDRSADCFAAFNTDLCFERHNKHVSRDERVEPGRFNHHRDRLRTELEPPQLYAWSVQNRQSNGSAETDLQHELQVRTRKDRRDPELVRTAENRQWLRTGNQTLDGVHPGETTFVSILS